MFGRTEGQRRPNLTSGFLFDESFDTALNETRARRILAETRENNLNSITHNILKRLIETKYPTLGQPTVHIWPRMLYGSLTGRYHMRDVKLIELIELAQTALNLQEDHYINHCSKHLKDAFQLARQRWKAHHLNIPKEILHAFSMVQDLTNVMDRIRLYYDNNKVTEESDDSRKTYQTEKISMKTITNATITFLGSLVILDIDGYIELHVVDYLKMMFNKAMDCASTLLLAWLLSGVCYTNEFFSKIIKLLKLVYQYFPKNGNDAYTVLKAFNGIADGLALEREEDWINTELIDDLWTSLLDLQGLSRNRENDQLIILLKTFETQELFEVGGLSKLYGHPDIQVSMGLNKLYQRSHKEIEISSDDAVTLANHLLLQYCHAHFLRNHRWPIMTLLPGTNPAFVECILKNMWITDPRITTRFGTIHLKDWSSVYMGQNDYFDYVDAIVPILADKAVALPRSRIYQKLAHPETKISTVERRVLLNFLFNEELPISVRQYLKNVSEINNDSTDDHLEYLVIKLTQKEKELKIEGRFFGQSPFIERTRRVILERNAAKLMKQYCPHQAMTLTELERIKRLWLFSQLHSVYPGHRIIQISIDFEAWNNYFRHQVMSPSWRAIIDGWYGVTYYHSLMRGFENTFYIHPNDTEFHYWYGQRGGIEGLIQYSWELVFVGMITETMERLGYPYHMLSNGDDCRLAIAIPEFEMADNPAGRVHELKVELERATSKYGLKVKISETYSSEKLIAFGKIYQCNRAWMPSILKRGAKIHGFGNTIIPFQDQRIASCYSNSHSSCGVGTVHNLLWLCAGFWHLWFWEKRQGKYKLTKDELVIMLMWPSVLGGQPVIPLYHFYVRGESDHLSVYLALYQFIANEHPRYRKIIERILCHKHCPNKQNIMMLLNDAYSLNLTPLGQPLLRLRKITGDKLKSKVKYKELKQVFNYTSESTEILFLEVLRSAKPYPARVMSEIYSCSPFALKSQIVRQFESARTIFQFLLVSGMRFHRAIRLYSNLVKDDEQLASRRAAILKGCSSFITHNRLVIETSVDYYLDPLNCPTALAQKLRCESWGLDITEVTYPPVTELTYIKYPGLDGFTDYETDNHFKFVIESFPTSALKGSINRHFCIGEHSPFLGHTTSEKIDSDFRLHDLSSPAAQKVINLLRIHAHTHTLGSNLKDVIEYVFRQISRLNFEEISKFVPPRQSGTITHRFSSRSFKRSIMPNEKPNRYTHVIGISDTCQKTRGQIGDWSINFLATMCQNICMVLCPMEYSGMVTCLPDVGEAHSIVTACPACYYNVEDEVVTLTKADLIPSLSNVLRCSLITLSTEEEAKLVENITEYNLKKIPFYVSLKQPDFESPELIRQSCNLVMQMYMSQSELHSNFLQENPKINAREQIKIQIIIQQLSNTPSILLGRTELFHLPITAIINNINEYLSGWLITHFTSNLKLRSGALISTLPPAVLPLTPLFSLLIKTHRWAEWVTQLQKILKVRASWDELTNPMHAQKFLLPIIHDHMVTWMESGYFRENSQFVIPKEKTFLTVHENVDIAVESFIKRLPVYVAMIMKSLLHDQQVQILLLMKYIRKEIRTKISQAITTLHKLSKISSNTEAEDFMKRERKRRDVELKNLEDQAKDYLSTEMYNRMKELRSDIRVNFNWPLKPYTFLLNIFAQAEILPSEYMDVDTVFASIEKLEGLIKLWNDDFNDSIAASVTPFYLDYFGFDKTTSSYVLSLYNIQTLQLTDNLVEQMSNPERVFIVNPLIDAGTINLEDSVTACVVGLFETRFGDGIMEFLERCDNDPIVDRWLRHGNAQMMMFSNTDLIDDSAVTISRIEKSVAVDVVRHLENPTLIDLASMQRQVRASAREISKQNESLIELNQELPSQGLGFNFNLTINGAEISSHKDASFDDVTFENLITATERLEREHDIPAIALAHNALRPLGSNTSSCSKIYSILWDYYMINPLNRLNQATILACGDGSGGNTRLCLELFKQAIVIFNTLLEGNLFSENFITPVSLQTVANTSLLDRCLFDHNYRGLNDLTYPPTIDKLFDLLKEIDENLINYNIILNDARSYDIGSNNHNQFRLTSQITFNIIKRMRIGRTILISRFIYEITLECFHFLMNICLIFNKVSLTKPVNSPFLNQEIYIICVDKIREVEEDTEQEFLRPKIKNIQLRRRMTNVLRSFIMRSYTSLLPEHFNNQQYGLYRNMMLSTGPLSKIKLPLIMRNLLAHQVTVEGPVTRQVLESCKERLLRQFTDMRIILFQYPRQAKMGLLRLRKAEPRLTTAIHKIHEMINLIQLLHMAEFLNMVLNCPDSYYDLFTFFEVYIPRCIASCRLVYDQLILPNFHLVKLADNETIISAVDIAENPGAFMSLNQAEAESIKKFWEIIMLLIS
ncbi:RNA-dependent RNA polymerase [Hubei myriapoda virus 8]|uniref:Replicase n=1 Tax=Hubei myriapoda virus 8 TaxID=1922937 RepID=A0A1L3KN37_9VIRU|nr:RNA-dependent RNA polymerase [Hubei myriapoda virus 8]APG78798.1 RNA-dependent RNA polymerase [Hubei myriapoda virus 8]